MSIDLTPTLICHDGDEFTLPAWQAALKVDTAGDTYGECDDALWHPDLTLTPAPIAACTQEDGSDPGQLFPCAWDAHVQGNGRGVSFLMPAADTYLYEDGTLLCPAGTWANDALDGCEPLPVSAANDQLPAAPLTVAEVAVPVAPAHVELAATGLEPSGWVAAALMVVVGISMVKMGARRSS